MMKHKMTQFVALFAFVLIGSTTAFADPVIEYFTVTPTTVTEGGTVELAWSVTGADKIMLDSGAVTASGTKTVTPSATGNVTYTLEATCSDCQAVSIFSGTTPTQGITLNATANVIVKAAVTPAPVAPAAPVTTVSAPTLNEWGMIILISFMAIVSVYRIRRMNQS